MSNEAILMEIREMISELKEKLDNMESMLGEFVANEQAGEPEESLDVSNEPIEIDLDVQDDFDDIEVPQPIEEPAAESEPEESAEPEPEAAPAVEEEPEPEETAEPEQEMAADPEPEVVEAPAVEEEPEVAPVAEEIEDLPEPEGETLLEPISEPAAEKEPASINDKAAAVSAPSVMDTIKSASYAWKVDMPGAEVRNILSGISLNDRILFINTLFGEDPFRFQSTISAFNSMSTLSEAEEYIAKNHSDWNLDSEIVYRMMMAVRRKLR